MYTVAGVILGLVATLGVLALAAGFVYLLRQGVQFALGDLVIAMFVLGTPPAFGALLTPADADAEQMARVWVGALAITLLVAAYLGYGFYWASINPAPHARGRLGQRFGPALVLAAAGIAALLTWHAFWPNSAGNKPQATGHASR
jgi:hypothetical protein